MGRPPASVGERTRERILASARACFAEGGYASTTNNQIAAMAGISAAALYRYFPSKLDLYVAVYEDVQDHVYERFREAIAGHDSFLGEFGAVLDASGAMNRKDPTVTRFLITVRTDLPRHKELRSPTHKRAAYRVEFFGAMVDRAVERGEIVAADRQVFYDVVSTVLSGLVFAASDDFAVQMRALAGVRRLFSGTLLPKSPQDSAQVRAVG